MYVRCFNIINIEYCLALLMLKSDWKMGSRNNKRICTEQPLKHKSILEKQYA